MKKAVAITVAAAILGLIWLVAGGIVDSVWHIDTGAGGGLLLFLAATALLVGFLVRRILGTRKGTRSDQSSALSRRLKYCVNCGCDLPMNAIFCDACGTKQVE